MKFKFSFIVCFFIVLATANAQTPVDIFYDNFNRAAFSPGPTGYSSTGAIAWNSTLSGPTISISGSTFLRIANGAAAGNSYCYIDNSKLDSSFTAVNGTVRYFNPALGLTNQIGTVEWMFNARARNGIYSTTKYVVVLAADNSDFNNATCKGYALYLSRASTNNQKFSLCSFNGGLATGNVTEIIGEGTVSDLTATTNYASVRVTYNPVNDTWSLFVRDDGGSAFTDPTVTAVTSQKGTATVNTDYVSNLFNLRYTGFYWKGSTVPNTSGDFDNFKMQVSSYPVLKILAPSYNTPASGFLLTGFLYPFGFGPSSEQLATINCTNLTDPIGIKAPASYEIKDTSSSGSGLFTDSLTYYPVNGTINNVSFAVRLKAGLNVATYNERINLKSPNVSSKQIICNGNVVAPGTAYVYVSTTVLSQFSNTEAGYFSSSKNFTVSGASLGANPITISAPVNYQMSTDNVNFSTNNIVLNPNGSGNVAATVIYVRYAPTGLGLNSGAITISNPLVPNYSVSVSGYLSAFYYKGTGNLDVLTNWSAKTDGTGTSPVDFSTAGVLYKIVTNNVNTSSIGSIPWTVSGSGSRIVIGDPAYPGVTFIYQNGITAPISGTINIPSALSGANKILLQDPTVPSFSNSTLSASSEVHYQVSASISSALPVFGKLFVENNSILTISSTPTIQSQVFIAEGSTLRTLNGGTYCKLNMLSGASVVINGTVDVQNSAGLSCAACNSTTGAVFNFAGTPNVSFGTNSLIQYAKAGNQNIQPYTYQNLEIGGGASKVIISSGGSSTMAYVIGKLTVLTGSTLITADLLTLKSDANGTARIGPSYGIINGNVIIERYITARKAWRLLSMPTQHNAQTINQAWQEGALTPNANPKPGYGIQLVSNRASWLTDGFDTISNAGATIKTYNSLTNLWEGVISTKSVGFPDVYDGKFINGKAYMTFVRGSRAKTRFTDTPDSTVLREKGLVNIGNVTIDPQIAAGQFAAIGNPYACAIDFSATTRNNLAGFFYLWDPKLGTYGGYQTISANGALMTPGGGSYDSRYPYIESGQGFFVQADNTTNPHTITFSETNKVETNALVTRTYDMPAFTVKAQLYNNASTTANLLDGTMVIYSDQYSNLTDEKDAKKLFGFGEQLFLKSNNSNLAIESRIAPLVGDTLHLQLTSLKLTNYKLNIMSSDIIPNGMGLKLIDHYTGQTMVLSAADTNWYIFTVNANPESYASGRFELVYVPLAPVPVRFVMISAKALSNNQTLITWKVAEQLQLVSYNVQRSPDGLHFKNIAQLNVSALDTYQYIDANLTAGIYYYRINALSSDGSEQYSHIVKIQIGKQLLVKPVMYPNPVIASQSVTVKVPNLLYGKSSMKIMDATSRIVYASELVVSNGQFELDNNIIKNLSIGCYYLVLGYNDMIEKIPFSIRR